MARKYLGGSGERLTVWISIAASTVLIFYGYDQGVFGNVIINENVSNTEDRTALVPRVAATQTVQDLHASFV